MPYDPERQAFADDEHLRLLSIGYYISAAITAFFSVIGLLYAFMGAAIGLAVSKAASDAATQPNEPAPQVVGFIIGAIGVGFFLVLVATAALKFYAGRCLKQRKSRTFCMVIAALSCLEIPYGTILGVFTIMVLERPTVARLFGVIRPQPPNFPPTLPSPPRSV